MTVDEALAVFERKEVPHRYVDTGQAKELYPALKDAGDALAAEVSRLRTIMSAVVPDCQWMQHAKKDRHDIGEPCPVVARFKAALGGDS